MSEPLADGIYPASLGYRPDPDRLSPNGAKRLLPPSTPSKFDEYRRNPPGPKRVWDFGSVAHKLVLGEGDQFLVLDPEIHGLKKDGTVADNPRATAGWKEAETRARAEGLTPIHVDDYRKAVAMAQKVHQHETAGPLLATRGDAEQWLYWTDTKSGQKLRQRLDWITSDNGRLTIVEYKTAAEAHPETFARRGFKLGYFLAFAFAVEGATALFVEPADYVFIAQEKEPPYDLAVCEPDAEALQVAQRQMRDAIETYRRCTEAGVWPGYPVGRNPISVPLWAIDDEMEF